MIIIHISAECYPIAKVGGLADVVGALPKYQANNNTRSQVIMPLYDNAYTKKQKFKSIYNSQITFGNQNIDFEILTLENNTLGFEMFFVKIPNLLFVDYVYSYDDSNRFLAFQIAVLDWVLTLKKKPTIIHCHDHHTALIPFMLQESFKYKSLNKILNILTIHNAQYQGWFSHDKIGLIPKFNFDHVGLLDWNHSINPLAAGIKCAWRVTTVSPSYMGELKIKANGLESLLNQEKEKCIGILNGIDTNVWNTETDEFLVKNYSKKTIISGKKANKKWLCDKFDLDINKPLFAFIGRLVLEKGADLFPEIFDKALKNNNISILLLGSGDENIEKELELLKEKHKDNYKAHIGNYNAYIGYDEKLSHIIYAGADFLLMPSRVEPCGLNQMYSLRYGTIPIVNNVGGLKDTVIDISKKGFGFVQNQVTVTDTCKAIKRATKFYSNTTEFKKNRKFIMQIDHSWDASAQEYINLYNTLIN